MRLKITCRQVWNQLSAALSVHGAFHATDATDAQRYAAGLATTHRTASRQQAPCLVFADGDAFSSVCSSANLIFNGTSISLNRQNRFWRDWMRTQVACEDAARIYKACGGSYDKYDQTPVVVNTGAIVDTNAGTGVGCTQDSGINERSKNLFAMTTGLVDGDGFSRELQVSYPVPLPPFNPWRGHSLPASCPYKSCPLAIPHLSSGSLDFLLEDFEKAFIRRLGGGGGNANAGTIIAGTNNNPIGISIVPDKTYVELKYYRLSHSRSLKESYRLAIWQAQTFLGEAPPNAQLASKGFEQYGDLVAMKPVGKDGAGTSFAGQHGRSEVSSSQENKTWKIQFDTLNLAQIPSFLLISCPKTTDSYTVNTSSDVRANVPNCVRNLSNNLYIKTIRIIVNSARGSIEKSADTDTGFIDAERLWQMTRENCNSKYFAEGGFRAWRDRGCAILLSSPQFAAGLQACDGVAYPVQIQIEMEVQNRAVDVNALSVISSGAVRLVNLANYGHKVCHNIEPDFIRAQAQCTAFYQKVVLATTETSASVNAMNYPLASAERLLNAAGSRF